LSSNSVSRYDDGHSRSGPDLLIALSGRPDAIAVALVIEKPSDVVLPFKRRAHDAAPSKVGFIAASLAKDGN